MGAVLPVLCTMLLVMDVLVKATEPMAVVFRPEFATMGRLTKAILRRNYGAIPDTCQRANAEEVWNMLRTLIVEQLGVRLNDVTKEASFVEDLGADR